MRGIFISDAPIIAHTSSGGGLRLPDAIDFNVRRNAGSGPDPLRSIDFTSAELDERVTFSCASQHAYIDESGLIQYAPADVWPLEYRDGVAVGRHPPEPARTNYTLYSNLAVRGTWKTYRATLTPAAAIAPDGLGAAVIENTNAGTWNGIYQPSSVTPARDLLPLVASCFARAETPCQFYVENANVPALHFEKSGQWKYGVYRVPANLTSQNYAGVLVFYSDGRPATGDKFAGWGFQTETGEFSTSPIITTDKQATRAVGRAFVRNPGSAASGIRINYHNGSSVIINPPADDSDYPVPHSAADWGALYISTIEYLTA